MRMRIGLLVTSVLAVVVWVPARCLAASCNPGARTLPRSCAVSLPNGFNLRVPFNGRHTITNGYGSGWHQHRCDPTHSNDYYALDFDLSNDPVLAMQSGRIIYAGWSSDGWSPYGRIVIVDHRSGYQSLYAHLSRVDVRRGQNVAKGKQLGISGRSGYGRNTYWTPHLHIAMYKGAHVQNPGGPYGGQAVVPEPMSGWYGLRQGNVIWHGGCGGAPTCRFVRTDGTVWQIFNDTFRRAFVRAHQFETWACKHCNLCHNPWQYIERISERDLRRYENRGQMDLLIRRPHRATGERPAPL